MRAASVVLVLAAAQSLRAADVPDFRPGIIELALGASALMLPADELTKTGITVGVALALRRNLVFFTDWTQLSSGGHGSYTVEGQILCAGMQYQVARIRLPGRVIPYAEGGFSLANTQLIGLPLNTLHDNDAGTRPGWTAGGGVRIPFGREARAGLRLGYRHTGQPNALVRRHLHQFTVQFLVFLRPR
jgi:hypothetical protein